MEIPFKVEFEKQIEGTWDTILLIALEASRQVIVSL
jgi:hypothetical protein